MYARNATPGTGSEPSDFLAPILALGEGPRARAGWVLAILGAFAIHGSLAAQRLALLLDLQRYAESVRLSVVADLQTYIAVETAQPPPPPPPPPAPEPTADPEVPTKAPPATRAESAPPPAAAEAGKVLTAEPNPNEPVDLTGDGFVTGTGTAYAGGTTTSNGTSKTAVYDPRARGAEAPAPALPAAETHAGSSNLSRAARPLSEQWDDCGFPPEADAEQINHARVSVAVTVAPDGSAKSVAVLSDPGYGFGQLARRCASRRRFQAALDNGGRPITSTTKPFTILFTR